MGHSMCIRAFLHVGHARSLWVHEAHHDMMCAYVTLRWLIDYYIRDGRESSLSVCVV